MTPDADSPTPGVPAHRLLLPVTLAIVVFTSRAWLVGAWGSAVPFWDQWSAEGALYRAWLTDSLSWRDIFAAHNEHRIALTRLADLALFALCGGWNPWAQMLLNAGLHAATAAIVGAVLLPSLPRGARLIGAIGLGLLFTAPAGWQNALWGFQSQVYFANLLAVLAFAGLTAMSGRLRGWIAAGALLLGFLSNAGGLLAALVAFALVWPTKSTRQAWVACGAVGSLVLLGVLLHPAAPSHAGLQSRTVNEFLAVFARGLGWPHVNSAWAWLVMLLPLAGFALWGRHAIASLSVGPNQTGTSHHAAPASPGEVSRPSVAMGLRDHFLFPAANSVRSRVVAADRFALALVGFALLQAAAVAYTRGAGLPDSRPLSRYQDPLILGAAGQLYFALRAATACGRRGRILLLGWSGTALLGLLTLTTTNLSLNLPYKRATDNAAQTQIRTYLATGQRDAFAASTYFAGPQGDLSAVIAVLDDPRLRPSLPAEFRGQTSRPWFLDHAAALTLIAAVGLIATTLAQTKKVREPPGRVRPAVSRV